MGERRRWPLVPRSLLGRMLLLTLLAILVAQGLSSLFWLSHLRSSQREGLLTSSRSLAYSMAASVSYFRSLPIGYRPLVLDQLRSMGGTRFFVSLNERPLQMQSLPDTPNKQAVLDIVRDVLQQKLGKDVELEVEFVAPDDLRLFNSQLKLEELPRSWAHYALTLEPVNPPVLVTQIRIGENEWLYIASLMPAPYVSLEPEALQPQQLLSIGLTSLLLLLFAGLLVHQQSRPLKRLARAAREVALGSPAAPLEERGARELVEVSRAFNTMRESIDRYLSERGQLFSAISHDLRTPITRLRLRVELLDDEPQRDKLNQDLDELELLVKGALQCVKDTDIHENIEPVDVNQLLQHVAGPYLADGRVKLLGEAGEPYPGKPLALRRCIGNLLDNALKYGERAQLQVEDGPEALLVHVDDEGPGVPEQRLEQVFEPRVRLSQRGQGYGLGLGIARNIAHTHGGEVSLQNRREGGLRVTLRLPRLVVE
ncbi:ATP-binding protein [Pseudomonas sp. R3.Fl]|uniref:ATP-binding protein n=1 Tax=Pseudomonas TaxID=286 RepID=UPI00201D5679|nr:MULTISPECIES: ATP-binding protein [Pseudomonas]MCL6691808.1 ATP-binding protein [Pseudomonas sp. R3.Fl]UXJ51234.1 ATP-binding protein [Pseudomonas citronellolis]